MVEEGIRSLICQPILLADFIPVLKSGLTPDMENGEYYNIDLLCEGTGGREDLLKINILTEENWIWLKTCLP